MRVGTVTEIKKQEFRVGLTPNCVQAYTAAGHTVYAVSYTHLAAMTDPPLLIFSIYYYIHRFLRFFLLKIKKPHFSSVCLFSRKGKINFFHFFYA